MALQNENEKTREIIEDLLANDPSFACLHVIVDDHDEEGLCEIFNALKQNTTVTHVSIEAEFLDGRAAAGDLRTKPCMSLASALSTQVAVSSLYFETVNVHGFSPIAMAIHQNKNLTSLEMQDCEWTMESLDWLLAENGLEEMCVSWPLATPLNIATGLQSNTSLKRLRFHSETSLSLETLNAIPVFLQRNQVIESIGLGDYSMAAPPKTIARIAEAVAKHDSLTSVSFMRMGDLAVVIFAQRIQGSIRLKSLLLDSNQIGDAGAVALSSALRRNTSLEKLYLYNNEISDEGVSALADALCDNSVLKEIGISFNPIGDEGAAAFAKMLTHNTTLTILRIGGFTKHGMIAFASCLPSMYGLKKLDMFELHGVTSEGSNAFLDALEDNTELEYVAVDASITADFETRELLDDMRSKMKYQMALNKAGKRILKSDENDVPGGLWPLILEQSSHNPDALYFFLRKKPDVLINKPLSAGVSRKRKRSWFSGWF